MNMTDFANRLLAGPPRVCCPACDKDMGLKPPAATEHHGRRGSHGEGEGMKAPWTWTEKGKNSGYYSSLKDADGYPIIMLHDIYTGYAECGEELVMEIDDPVALLIAAAPDMRQALVDFLTYWNMDMVCQAGVIDKCRCRVCIRERALFAVDKTKAEGVK